MFDKAGSLEVDAKQKSPFSFQTMNTTDFLLFSCILFSLMFFTRIELPSVWAAVTNIPKIFLL